MLLLVDEVAVPLPIVEASGVLEDVTMMEVEVDNDGGSVGTTRCLYKAIANKTDGNKFTPTLPRVEAAAFKELMDCN